MSTPSEALAQGKCPYCGGDGEVFSIIHERKIKCRLCGGSGEWKSGGAGRPFEGWVREEYVEDELIDVFVQMVKIPLTEEEIARIEALSTLDSHVDVLDGKVIGVHVFVQVPKSRDDAEGS